MSVRSTWRRSHDFGGNGSRAIPAVSIAKETLSLRWACDLVNLVIPIYLRCGGRRRLRNKIKL